MKRIERKKRRGKGEGTNEEREVSFLMTGVVGLVPLERGTESVKESATNIC